MIFLPKIEIFSNFQYVSFTIIIITKHCVLSRFEWENPKLRKYLHLNILYIWYMGVRSFKNYTLKLTNSQTMLTAYVIVLMHINRAIFRFAVSSVLLLPDGTRCKGDLKSLFDETCNLSTGVKVGIARFEGNPGCNGTTFSRRRLFFDRGRQMLCRSGFLMQSVIEDLCSVA